MFDSNKLTSLNIEGKNTLKECDGYHVDSHFIDNIHSYEISNFIMNEHLDNESQIK